MWWHCQEDKCGISSMSFKWHDFNTSLCFHTPCCLSDLQAAASENEELCIGRSRLLCVELEMFFHCRQHLPQGQDALLTRPVPNFADYRAWNPHPPSAAKPTKEILCECCMSLTNKNVYWIKIMVDFINNKNRPSLIISLQSILTWKRILEVKFKQYLNIL